MKKSEFGTLSSGETVHLYTLDNGVIQCQVTEYGAAMVSLHVPNRQGGKTDILLGMADARGYETQTISMGATVGRCANRIEHAAFELEGKRYSLFKNAGENHLHGGKIGFAKRIWQVEEIENGICFSHTSKDGEDGYPATLHVRVCYELIGASLSISYHAVSDGTTICNLTNHGYYNLNGHNDGSILDHVVTLYAGYFTPFSDSKTIPSGEIRSVKETALDFTNPTEIGKRIDAKEEQMLLGHGYDHNFIVDGEIGTLRPCATVFAPKTGIKMHLDTTSPAVQFYTGNFLSECPAGKDGVKYGDREGFCLETQFYPDAINKPMFPSVVLEKGKTWQHKTVHTFSVTAEP